MPFCCVMRELLGSVLEFRPFGLNSVSAVESGSVELLSALLNEALLAVLVLLTEAAADMSALLVLALGFIIGELSEERSAEVLTGGGRVDVVPVDAGVDSYGLGGEPAEATQHEQSREQRQRVWKSAARHAKTSYPGGCSEHMAKQQNSGYLTCCASREGCMTCDQSVGPIREV